MAQTRSNKKERAVLWKWVGREKLVVGRKKNFRPFGPKAPPTKKEHLDIMEAKSCRAGSNFIREKEQKTATDSNSFNLKRGVCSDDRTVARWNKKIFEVKQPHKHSGKKTKATQAEERERIHLDARGTTGTKESQTGVRKSYSSPGKAGGTRRAGDETPSRGRLPGS